jgi:hypothetical protein
MSIILMMTVGSFPRDQKTPDSQATSQYDSTADIKQINDFLRSSCYQEKTDLKAPADQVAKDKCSGSIDNSCILTIHNLHGFGPPGINGPIVKPLYVEDWFAKCDDLGTFAILDEIVLFCRRGDASNGTCATYKSAEYSVDGKTFISNTTDTFSYVPIPTEVPRSLVVEVLFRPLERLSTPDHTDKRTCSSYHCE